MDMLCLQAIRLPADQPESKASNPTFCWSGSFTSSNTDTPPATSAAIFSSSSSAVALSASLNLFSLSSTASTFSTLSNTNDRVM